MLFLSNLSALANTKRSDAVTYLNDSWESRSRSNDQFSPKPDSSSLEGLLLIFFSFAPRPRFPSWDLTRATKAKMMRVHHVNSSKCKSNDLLGKRVLVTWGNYQKLSLLKHHFTGEPWAQTAEDDLWVGRPSGFSFLIQAHFSNRSY